MSTQRTIRLVEDADGWTAIDEESGVECQGEDRSQVLARLDEAVAISFDDDGDADEEGKSELDWFED